MKVLITGFEPFGGAEVNWGWEAVRGIGEIVGAEVFKYQLPTVFNDSLIRLDEVIGEVKPEVVICVGEAGGRDGVTPEKVAINYDNARIPDNNGKSPRGVPIVKNGQDGYFTGLPINNIVRNILKNDVTSSVSYTAGTYVCNHVFYGLMHLIKTKYTDIRGGFIHVPVKGNMELNKISKGLEIAIETTIHDPGDRITDGGIEG